MNIFILHDTDFAKCAQWHNDKHVVKMPTESVQLLDNALRRHDKEYKPLYNVSHFNHPSSIWTSNSRENFEWLLNLADELCKEYTYRYNKIHLCESSRLPYLKTCYSSMAKLPKKGLTPFHLGMPDKYKTDNAVESYRLLYRNGKDHLAKWKNRTPPEWWEETKIIL